jgi:hypothetical protein
MVNGYDDYDDAYMILCRGLNALNFELHELRPCPFYI